MVEHLNTNSKDPGFNLAVSKAFFLISYNTSTLNLIAHRLGNGFLLRILVALPLKIFRVVNKGP